MHRQDGRRPESPVATRVERARERVVMDDVDALGRGDLLDHAAHLQCVHDLRIRLAEAVGDGAIPQRNEPRRGARLSGAEHGHLVSTCDNRVGQIGHDGLYTPIAIRRNLEVGRRDEHDPQWIGAIRENFSATHSRSSPRGSTAALATLSITTCPFR